MASSELGDNDSDRESNPAADATGAEPDTVRTQEDRSGRRFGSSRIAGAAERERLLKEARDVDFPIGLRGYERAAVDRYVERVTRLLTELEMSSSPESAVRHALDEVSEETRDILQRAHQTADEITARSRNRADERVQEAEREGEQMVDQARQEAEQIRDAARRDANELSDKTAGEVENLREAAQHDADELHETAQRDADELRERTTHELTELRERTTRARRAAGVDCAGDSPTAGGGAARRRRASRLRPPGDRPDARDSRGARPRAGPQRRGAVARAPTADR